MVVTKLSSIDVLLMMISSSNANGVNSMTGLEFFPGIDLTILRSCGGLSGWRATFVDFTLGLRRIFPRTFYPEQDISYMLVDMSQAQLIGTDLSNSNLSGCNLHQAEMAGALLFRSELQNSDLSQANLEKAICTYANFNASYLMLTNFHGANLRKAGLSHCFCWLTDFSYADLCGADFSQATFQQTKFVGAHYNNATRWPDDFDPTQITHGLIKE